MFQTIMAHAGHGITSGNSLLHYLFEPVHLLLLVVGSSAAAGLATWFGLRVLRLRPNRVRK